MFTKKDLINNINNWIEKNGKVPKKCEMLKEDGYISSYQYEKYFKTRKWNIILEGLGFDMLNNKQWTDKEVLYVKENYKHMSDLEISKNIERSERSISYKRNELGLLKQSIKQPWQEWEIDFLANNFYAMPIQEICNKLSHRKWETIRAYATKKLNLHRKHSLYKYQMPNGMRVCKKCGLTLKENEENFHLDKGSFRSMCKTCWNEQYYIKVYGINYEEKHYGKYKKLYDINNHKHDSVAEKIITDWLINNNINFECQPNYRDHVNNDETYRRFDWIVYDENSNKKYVEYFGIWDKKHTENAYINRYVKSAKKKIKKLYKENMFLDCIFIFPSDLKNKKLEEIFADVCSN